MPTTSGRQSHLGAEPPRFTRETVDQAVESLKERIKQLAVFADMHRSAINSLRSLPTKKVSFVETMECLSVSKLPEGSQWLWEIKLDGYRALAVKSGSGVTLLSRRRKSLNRQFSYIAESAG